MDLSNLSTDLPPTKPITQSSINDLSKDLTTEFKNAAKSVATLYNSSMSGNVSTQKAEFANAARSVAALYRLSNNATSLLQTKGYLNCLDDMLQLIAHDVDVENWVLTKRAEITNINNEAPSSPPSEDFSLDFKLPNDFKFTFNHEVQPEFPFVPGFPPLSVQHPRRKDAKKDKKEPKKDIKKDTKKDTRDIKKDTKKDTRDIKKDLKKLDSDEEDDTLKKRKFKGEDKKKWKKKTDELAGV